MENTNIKEDNHSLKIKDQFKSKKNRTRFITRVSMFSALSFIFYAFLKFPLPIFPSFLEINFSSIFIIIGSLSTGPIGALLICIIRFILKIIIVPTHTAFVGEIVDLILTLSFALPGSLYYMKHHDKKGGYISIVISLLSWVLLSLPINGLIALPLYIKFGGLSEDTIINAMSMIKGVTIENYKTLYVFACVLPFNLILSIINCGTAFLVYKKISVLLRKIGI